MPHREGSGACPTPTTIHHPAPHTALRRLVARQPVAALLIMVYTVNTAVALVPVLTRRDVLPFDLAPYDALGHIFGVALPAFIVVAAISGKSGVQDLARRRGLVPRCVLWRARRIGVVCQRALWSCAANALVEKWELLLTVVLPKLLLLIVSFNLAEEVGGYLGQLYLHFAAPKGSQG